MTATLMLSAETPSSAWTGGFGVPPGALPHGRGSVPTFGPSALFSTPAFEPVPPATVVAVASAAPAPPPFVLDSSCLLSLLPQLARRSMSAQHSTIFGDLTARQPPARCGLTLPGSDAASGRQCASDAGW